MLLLMACSGAIDSSPPPPPEESGIDTEPPPGVGDSFALTVTLDGDAAEEVTVSQGGRTLRWATDAEGKAIVELDRSFDEVVLMASHPEARIRALIVGDEATEGLIELARFDPSDNPDYLFDDPGSPTQNDTTAYCAHCHVTTVEDWYGSVHRQAASNPVV